MTLCTCILMRCTIKKRGPLEIMKRGFGDSAWLRQFWMCLNTFQNIDILKDWCLLPCSFWDGDKKTVALSHAQIICDVDSFKEKETNLTISFRTLRDVFDDLNLPRLSRITSTSKHIRELVATFKYPNKIVNCLYLNKENVLWSKLQNNDCNEILKYLNDVVTNFDSEEKERLDKLPLFTTLTGRIVSFDDEDKRLIVKCGKLPTMDGLNEISKNTNTLLIKNNTFLENLYHVFGSSECYSTKKHPLLLLYTSFILPNFRMQPKRAQLCHLEFIHEELLIKKTYSQL